MCYVYRKLFNHCARAKPCNCGLRTILKVQYMYITILFFYRTIKAMINKKRIQIRISAEFQHFLNYVLSIIYIYIYFAQKFIPKKEKNCLFAFEIEKFQTSRNSQVSTIAFAMDICYKCLQTYKVSGHSELRKRNNTASCMQMAAHSQRIAQATKTIKLACESWCVEFCQNVSSFFVFCGNSKQ